MLLQACGNPLSLKSSCESGFYTTDAGRRMQWADGSRIDFQMHNSVPSAMREVIVASGDRYNDAFSKTHLNVVVSDEITTPTFNGDVDKVSGDNINAIYWVREKDWAWAESDPDAVAMTVVNFSRTGISESDVFFRAQIFNRDTSSSDVAQSKFRPETASSSALDFLLDLRFSPLASLTQAAYNASTSNPNPRQHQVFMVSVHELGHAIGRCHSEDPASIMYPDVSAGTVEQRQQPLSEIDLDILSQAYKP